MEFTKVPFLSKHYFYVFLCLQVSMLVISSGMLTDDSIQSMGGKARAEALSDDQRKDIARKAAEARWSMPKVGWEGEMTIGPVSIKCGVIPSREDGEKPLRVISETAFMTALGMYRSGALSVRREVSETGAQTPLSLAYKNLKPIIIKH